MVTGKIDIDGSTFLDEWGRHVILRGVNFGGDSKVPSMPNGHTHIPTNFSDHRTVSFIGRPAPLDELDSHFTRMRHWGFNCIRLLTTWEAVAHAGPGQFDEEYLDYFAEVCRRAGLFGLHVFVDFHQDAWSRMSGGDGAPGWTFEAVGLDFTKFHQTGAAHVMQYQYDHQVGGRQLAYPVMSWSGNYARPANGIMWTLFFAGNDFAPSLRVDGLSAQDFLQGQFLQAVSAVAERVAHLDNVIGFDSLNEPSTGYIGRAMSEPAARYRGPKWSPLDGLALAAGFARELEIIQPGKGIVGTERFNPQAVTIWLPGREDPFRAAGAWDMQNGNPMAVDEDFFRLVRGEAIDPNDNYMAPFFKNVADTVRVVRSDWLLFAEVDPFDMLSGHGFPHQTPERTVNASHWYDLSALVTKSFSEDRRVDVLTGKVSEGREGIEAGYVQEMTRIAEVGRVLNAGSGAPTLLGECGVQFDMNDAQAYASWTAGERNPDIWEAQSTALELMYNSIDKLLLSSTQWNYTVSNSNDPMVGDGWNQEDLSIWSADQHTMPDDPDSGGRAIDGFCRPYIQAAQGRIRSQRFDRRSGIFEAVIDVDPAISLPTRIFAPEHCYPGGASCSTSNGITMFGEQMILITSSEAGQQSIRLSNGPKRYIQ